MIRLENGEMRLSCRGTRQGPEGAMPLFRPALPDSPGAEYDLSAHPRRGLVIKFPALRELCREDALGDRYRLKPRAGVFSDEVGAATAFHLIPRPSADLTTGPTTPAPPTPGGMPD